MNNNQEMLARSRWLVVAGLILVIAVTALVQEKNKS